MHVERHMTRHVVTIGLDQPVDLKAPYSSTSTVRCDKIVVELSLAEGTDIREHRPLTVETTVGIGHRLKKDGTPSTNAAKVSYYLPMSERSSAPPLLVAAAEVALVYVRSKQ